MSQNKCKKCGVVISKGKDLCEECKTPARQRVSETRMEMHLYDALFYRKLHIPSLLVGIGSLALAFFTGFGGIALGIVGLVLARRAKEKYMSVTGHMLSLTGLTVGIAVSIILILSYAN